MHQPQLNPLQTVNTGSEPITVPKVVSHVLAYGILLGYVVFPLSSVLETAFLQGHARDSLFTSLSLFFESSALRALLNSLLLSIMSVIFAGLIGTTIAYLQYRYSFRFQALYDTVFLLPIGLPPLVGALSFQFLFSDIGLVGGWLQTQFHLAERPFVLEGLFGVAILHAYAFFAHFVMLLAPAFKQINPSLIEASRGLGATPFQTMRRVIFPLLRTPIFSASLFVFMLSMASFTAPLLFGGKDVFFTVELYNQNMIGNREMASLMTLALISISIPLLWLYEGSFQHFPSSQAHVRPLGARAPLGVEALLIAAGGVVLIPFLGLVILAFFPDVVRGQGEVLRPSLDSVAALLSHSAVLKAISNSVSLSILAGVPNLFFGLFMGILLARKRLGFPFLAQILLHLPVALPATALGVAILTAFSEPGWVSEMISLNGLLLGGGLLPLAYFIRHLPYIARSVSSALSLFNYSLIEAGATLGAGYVNVMLKVLLPLMLNALVSGFLFTLISAFIEFPCSILLYTPENQPVSIALFSLMREGYFSEAAALGLILTVMIYIILWLSRLSLSRIGNFDRAPYLHT